MRCLLAMILAVGLLAPAIADSAADANPLTSYEDGAIGTLPLVSVGNGTFVAVSDRFAGRMYVQGSATILVLSWAQVNGLASTSFIVDEAGDYGPGGFPWTEPEPRSSPDTVYTTCWPDRENSMITHCVNTPRRGQESASRHATRHKTAVDAMKAVFPPPAPPQ